MATAKKWVYGFHEGNAQMKELLGGKGANLAEMTNLGLPIPMGFTITTEACTDYYKSGRKISNEIQRQIFQALRWLEKENGKIFGDNNDPLLVSVRSGARVSMPGMMDTILNLGLNDISVEGFAKKTKNPRFAYDSYRRFIQMFSDVVMEVPKSRFEKIIDEIKEEKGVKFDVDLDVNDMKELIKRFKAIYKEAIGQDFPQEPAMQLLEAVKAVFRSWDNPRANVYRRMNDIPGDWGTAVNIQTMVFGNMGNTSGTGVAFTRNPATGARGIYGEYLIDAQGEDVVAGVRTPQPISKLEEDMPNCYREFIRLAHKLESHYRDMQDMEFTIQEGKLYFLQTRNGKRTAEAAINIACDLVEEGMITPEEAVLRIEAKSLDQLLHPAFDAEALKKGKVIGHALPASPGSAAGKVYFTAEDAKNAAAKGERVILVRLETSPEDIEGMHAAEGILTARGGMTSHAAVVARGMGTCCVSGCNELKVNEEEKKFELNGTTYREGDYISLDGSTGTIYEGDIPTVEAEISGNFGCIMRWADQYRKMQVRTNADTPADAENAVRLGAEGIGLCRTEHMFFDAERIPKFRRMILSDTVEQREAALAELLPYQREDFIGMYKALRGRPMTIRFLDPPLHEFLPKTEAEMRELAESMGLTYENVKAHCEAMHEFNPMMGLRGCRLSVIYPEISRMQTRAVIEAAISVKKEMNYDIVPEIMVPLIGDRKELLFVKNIIVETAEKVMKEQGYFINYKVGTMIEIPRAALTADEVAKEADFFSFGTNDLTQMTFGFSRDDAGKFLESYYDQKIYEFDPFSKLDQTGVGQLMKMAVTKGREENPMLHCGICGEHGGDPSSVAFCQELGLNYVSCSPFRVPIARLAAAQAAINLKNK
ncbi:MAG: pyruvate, phosphate dikinase [Acidaminococcaceae bacterium]|nr:pyruvate, phosphate dikinase [Acidaminococcaceae bacterium]MBQ8492401.1 pyruvate, phosphate dikinase [Acidaminococcaceae bacterium]MBQ9255909.1 pyruvate, phosphate dikinase [Acidaminococcaceae bacterium]MBQ9284482.1 pyruvate, phosphate dikinase [Acidaminococcaceae bacterium]MBQ9319730.1 pyruvate, phosphate dikinase [Acidaminococcaceae bacterium]